MRIDYCGRRVCGRRAFGCYSGLALLGSSMSGWLPALAARSLITDQQPKRSCILLWMSGGPSQLDTFDPKPDHENGGPVSAIHTSVPGLHIADNLPQLAGMMEHLVPIRSMFTREGDHTRATYYLHTGYLPQGPIQYPTLGSFVSRAVQRDDCDLPAFISINPFRAFSPGAFGPGFLGPAWSPLVVASSRPSAAEELSFEVQNLQPPQNITTGQLDARLQLLASLEHGFLGQRPGSPGASHLQSYGQAVRMMKSSAVAAFDLDHEDPALRDRYGRNAFGQGCLLARRLIEHGVSFVEVSLNGTDGPGGAGWDTHADNFTQVNSLCQRLDPAWATLMDDLQQRGLLEQTLVIWMGEFGRTPKINENTGRDHWPGGWTTVLGGGGIRGGQAYGQTSADGMEISLDPVSVPSLMATICTAMGLDPESTNISPTGRPIPFADHGAEPLQQLLPGS